MEEIAGKRNRRKGWKKKIEAMQERQKELMKERDRDKRNKCKG